MTPEEIDKKLKYLNDDWNFTLGNIQVIHKLCDEIKPRNVLNIGTSLGKSALSFKLCGVATVTSIDINPYQIEGINCLTGDSKTIHWDHLYDLVFIDGDHTYDGCMADIVKYLPWTRKVICGHDYWEDFPGVIRAVDDMFGDIKTVEGGIWIVRKSK